MRTLAKRFAITVYTAAVQFDSISSNIDKTSLEDVNRFRADLPYEMLLDFGENRKASLHQLSSLGGKENRPAARITLVHGEAWNKGIRIEMGQATVKQYTVYLRDLIGAGIAKPSFIVSQRLPLESAPDAYHTCDERQNGYSKVLLKPGIAPSRN